MSLDVHANTNGHSIGALVNPGGMSIGEPQCGRAWPVDEHGRMTFLAIPSSVDLSKQQKQKGIHGSDSSIANLPPELQCIILSHLPVIDRVCVALSCKTFAASTLASPLLRAPSWTPWLFSSDDTFPSKHLLIQRLAHGWTDKTRLRYCQKCQRILPRDAAYFQQRVQRGSGWKQKSLPWNHKVCLDKAQWNKLSNKKRYDHIIKLWTESDREDSSVFSCNICWTKEFNAVTPISHNYDGIHDLEKGTSHTKGGGLAHASQMPVECPCCVVHSLLNTYKEPRKPKFRPFLWKWTKKILSFVGNTILVLIYLLYLLFKAPFDLTRWSWRKYRRSGFKCKTMLCIK